MSAPPGEQPSARALEYAHDVRWPNDRIDLARLCEQYGDDRAREARAAAIEEAEQKIWDIGGIGTNTSAYASAIRALAAKPVSGP